MIFPNVKVQPHWLKTLEAAAENLPNCRWVCAAIVLGIEPKTEQVIREAIACAIAPSNIVDFWLLYETGIGLTKGEAKEYRIAWLNHMIAQCRAMQNTEFSA